MEIRVIYDVQIAHAFLKNKARYNYIYQFNNLDPNRWTSMVCYGLFDCGEVKEIAMLNINYPIPVLLAAGFNNQKYSIALIQGLKKLLPPKFYTHMDKETLEAVFSQDCIIGLEDYMNMGFCDYEALGEKNNDAERLEYKDIDAIKTLISASYPEAWLDDDLVKLNENFGIYEKEKLISFAGIHAYCKQYEVAAVAHVTTHPEYRKQGHAQKVVAALTKSLNEKIKYIGLNVKVDNLQAIKCYKKLGFKEFGKFVACEIEMRAE